MTCEKENRLDIDVNIDAYCQGWLCCCTYPSTLGVGQHVHLTFSSNLNKARKPRALEAIVIRHDAFFQKLDDVYKVFRGVATFGLNRGHNMACAILYLRAHTLYNYPSVNITGL
jgi:hypothetical protein